MTTTTLPAAFQDDLSEWIVTLEVRPTIRRWKPPHLRPAPVTKDITVVAPNELTALLLGRRSGYTVLHARSKVEYIAPPTCTECGAGVAASNDSGLCRHCAMKKVAATAPPKHQCIDCGATTKGFGKTNRCGACSFKATLSGVQPKQNTGHNTTGVCRACRSNRPDKLCQRCGAKVSPKNKSGKCISCAQQTRRPQEKPHILIAALKEKVA